MTSLLKKMAFTAIAYSTISIPTSFAFTTSDHCIEFEPSACTETGRKVNINFNLDETYSEAILSAKNDYQKVQYCPTIFFTPMRLTKNGKPETYDEYTSRLVFYPDVQRVSNPHIIYSRNQTLVRFSKQEMDIAINKMCNSPIMSDPKNCFERKSSQLILVESKILCGEFDRLVRDLNGKFKDKPYKHHLNFLLELIRKRYKKPGDMVLNYDDILKKIMDKKSAGDSKYKAMEAILKNDLQGYAKFIIPQILKSITMKWIESNFKNPSVLNTVGYAQNSINLARFSWIMLEIHKINANLKSNFRTNHGLLTTLTPYKLDTKGLPLKGEDNYFIEDRKYFSAWFILDYIESITSVITGDILQNLKKRKKQKANRILTNDDIKSEFKYIEDSYRLDNIELNLTKEDFDI
jgi:hypothetical protein